MVRLSQQTRNTEPQAMFWKAILNHSRDVAVRQVFSRYKPEGVRMNRGCLPKS